MCISINWADFWQIGSLCQLPRVWPSSPADKSPANCPHQCVKNGSGGIWILQWWGIWGSDSLAPTYIYIYQLRHIYASVMPHFQIFHSPLMQLMIQESLEVALTASMQLMSQESNVKCWMPNVKCQMSIRLNLLSERTSRVSPVIFCFDRARPGKV